VGSVEEDSGAADSVAEDSAEVAAGEEGATDPVAVDSTVVGPVEAVAVAAHAAEEPAGEAW